MQGKLLFGCIIALLLILTAAPSSAQAVYSAEQDRPVLSVGAGFSLFNQDYGPHETYGETIFADYHPPFMPDFLSGVNFEALARDISVDRQTVPSGNNNPNAGKPIEPRTDILGGGLIYHPQRLRFHRFEPYVRGLIAFGSIDFTSSNPDYSHDTRVMYEFGGGTDIRLTHRISARADYGYQFWPALFGRGLNPQGFTVGGMYNFGRR
jgi:opacity protein-like surface antigen